jgi:O-antigen ligase
VDPSYGRSVPPATRGRGIASATRIARLPYYVGTALLTNTRFRPGTYLDPSDFAFLVALIAVLPILPRIRLTMARGPEQYPPLLLYGCVLLAVGGFFSAFEAVHVAPAMFEAGEFLYLVLAWFGLGIIVLRTHAQVTLAIVIWTASAAVSGLAAVGQVFLDVLVTPEFYGRATGLTGQPNDLGGLAAVALVPAVALVIQGGKSWLRTIVAGLVLVGVVTALILSGSVGGLVGVAGGVAFFVGMLLTGRHRTRLDRRRLGIAALAATAAVLWLSAQPGSDVYGPLARISSVTGEHNRQDENPTLVSRLAIDDAAVSAIAKHPLLGSGLGEDAATGEFGIEVHNMYLGLWVGAGLPALVGLVIILLSLTAIGRAVVRDARSRNEWLLALALDAALLSFLLFAMSAPILIVRYGWAPGAFLVALRAVQKRELSRDAEARMAR